MTRGILSTIGVHFLTRIIGSETETGKPVVRIASLYQNGSTVEVPAQHHPTVFVLPGIDGLLGNVRPLAASLNVQVLGLDYSHEFSTIEDLAKTLTAHISDRLDKSQEFELIGYSFGGLVAMFAVKLLEEAGQKGRLWLIDCMHAGVLLKDSTKSFQGSPKNIVNQLQLEIISLFLDTIWPQKKDKMIDELKKFNDWNARLEHILELMPSDSSKRDQKILLDGAYNRALAAMELKWPEGCCLKAETTLIRPTEISSQATDDYGLSQFFNSPVKIHLAEGDHFTILKNKKTAEFIMAGRGSPQ